MLRVIIVTKQKAKSLTERKAGLAIKPKARPAGREELLVSIIIYYNH